MTVVLSPTEGADYLARYMLPLVPQKLAQSADAAARQAAAFGFPVVLKLITASVSHKSDAGGVRLDVRDADGARKVAEDLLSAGRAKGDSGAQVLVQPMAAGVAELIVGIAQDPTFGPVIAVGLGGTLTELFKDIALGIPPLSRRLAIDLLDQLRAAALLDGYRGSLPADREAVIDLLLKVSRIALDDNILELDLNPILVGAKGRGCVAVDNRVVLRDFCRRPTG